MALAEGVPRCPIRRGLDRDVYMLNSVPRTEVIDSWHVRWRPVLGFQFPAKFQEQLEGTDLDHEPGDQSDGDVEREDEAEHYIHPLHPAEWIRLAGLMWWQPNANSSCEQAGQQR